MIARHPEALRTIEIPGEDPKDMLLGDAISSHTLEMARETEISQEHTLALHYAAGYGARLLLASLRNSGHLRPEYDSVTLFEVGQSIKETGRMTSIELAAKKREEVDAA
jgi:hypothetical protein